MIDGPNPQYQITNVITGSAMKKGDESPRKGLIPRAANRATAVVRAAIRYRAGVALSQTSVVIGILGRKERAGEEIVVCRKNVVKHRSTTGDTSYHRFVFKRPPLATVFPS